LAWKADDTLKTTFSAQVANVTYHVACREYGHLAYVEVCDPLGNLKRVVVGNYVKIEQAQRACEQHYATGGDLRKAEKITR